MSLFYKLNKSYKLSNGTAMKCTIYRSQSRGQNWSPSFCLPILKRDWIVWICQKYASEQIFFCNCTIQLCFEKKIYDWTHSSFVFLFYVRTNECVRWHFYYFWENMRINAIFNCWTFSTQVLKGPWLYLRHKISFVLHVLQWWKSEQKYAFGVINILLCTESLLVKFN